MKITCNKDLIAAAIIALIVHVVVFFINPSWSVVQPRLRGDEKVIMVSLVSSYKPKPPKPSIPHIIKKTPKKVKIKREPKKAVVPKLAIPKEIEEVPEKAKVEEELEDRAIEEKEDHSEEPLESQNETEDDSKDIKAVVTMAIPNYQENPKPYYPRIARRRNEQGTVILRVEILEDGRVGRIEVSESSGFSSLDQSALKTVKKWHFIPGRIGNDNVTMWVNVPIRFQLADR